MYKDRVMNDKKDFEIPALPSSVKRENLEQVNSKYHIQVWIFLLQISLWMSKFLSVILYAVFLYVYPWFSKSRKHESREGVGGRFIKLHLDFFIRKSLPALIGVLICLGFPVFGSIIVWIICWIDSPVFGSVTVIIWPSKKKM